MHGEVFVPAQRLERSDDATHARIALIGLGEVGQMLAAGPAPRRAAASLCAWDLLFAARGQRARRAAALPASQGGELHGRGGGAAARWSSAPSPRPSVRRRRVEAAAALSARRALSRSQLGLARTRAQAARAIDAAGGALRRGGGDVARSHRSASPRPCCWAARTRGTSCHCCSARASPAPRSTRTRSGAASAAKMCRSVMVKGIEALLTESLLTARRHGVEDAVLASLQ